MEAKKNLCGMIPEELHARAVAEKEQLGLKTLGEYVELILKEHFEGGRITMAETKEPLNNSLCPVPTQCISRYLHLAKVI